MAEHAPVTVYEKRHSLSVPELLADMKGPIGLYAAIFAVLIPLMACSLLLCPFLYATFGFSASYVIACFVCGLLAGTTGVVLISTVAQAKARRVKKLMAVEQRLACGETGDLSGDLHCLVDENLKLKRFEVADFYSRRLLEVAHGASKLADVMLTTQCWASTPAYQKSWKYYVVWLFETRGTLTLTSSRIQFTSKRIALNIPIGDVRNVHLKAHPWWLKPYSMKFIVLEFVADGENKEIHLSPSLTEADTVWQVNSSVMTWFGYLNQARTKFEKQFEALDAVKPAPLPAAEEPAGLLGDCEKTA